MNRERYIQAHNEGHVTKEELAQGWHFCCELDEALVQYKDVASFCRCLGDVPPEKPDVAPDDVEWDKL